MSATDARERIIADSQFGAGATSHAPGTWYQGLSTTTPNDDGSGFTEPVGGAYTRVAKLNNLTNFPAATTAGGVTTKTNATPVTYPNPTGNWGTATHYGWFDAASGGLPQFWFALDAARTIESGNTPVEFAANALSMAWD